MRADGCGSLDQEAGRVAACRRHLGVVPLVAAVRNQHRGVAGVADQRHADHRPARHPARPAHRPLRAAVDRRRLHARHDRAGAQRRAAGRSLRAVAHVHPGLRHLHPRLGLLCRCAGRLPAHRRAHHPGRRRCLHVRQLGGAGDRRLPAPRAGQGAGHQRHGHRRGADPGPTARWLADDLRLADGLLVQPARRSHRHRRRGAHPGRAAPRAEGGVARLGRLGRVPRRRCWH